MVSYCGPTSSGSDSAMYKPDFEGACADMATCDPEDIKKMMALVFSSMGSEEGSTPSGSDSASESSSGVPAGMCGLYVGLTSEPGKCQADCFGGMSSLALCELFVL